MYFHLVTNTIIKVQIILKGSIFVLSQLIPIHIPAFCHYRLNDSAVCIWWWIFNLSGIIHLSTLYFCVLLCICICLGTKFTEVLWWQIPRFSEEGLWACCKCKLSPALVSGSATRSRLLPLSQLLLATHNLCLPPQSLCSEQASHLAVVRRLHVCWIFYLPSAWQRSTEHT